MTYLDHNATAPLLGEVLEAMLPWLRGVSGNASSLHSVGRRARAAIEAARVDVGALIGGDPAGVHFCSGGTEADVWALRSAFVGRAEGSSRSTRRTLALSAVEHPAVRVTAGALRDLGVRTVDIPVDSRGRLGELEPILAAGDVRLVAVMAANNETGNLYNVASIARRAHKHGALVHSDLVQAAGKIAVDVANWQVDTAALSAHKIGGPQGVGALWVRPDHDVVALITGGGQERSLRSGTENVAGIVGFGVAARIAAANHAQEARRTAGLRDELQQRLLTELPGCVVLGDVGNRLPNTLSMAFSELAGEALVMRLDALGISVSTGSACSSGSGEPSHVLVAMGLPAWQIKGVVRFSLGATTTADDVNRAAQATIGSVRALRALSAPLTRPKETTDV